MKLVIRLLLALAVLSAVQSSYVGVGNASHRKAARAERVASAAPSSSSAEERFVSLVNQERKTRGLAPLAVNPDLRAVAGNWTGRMVSNSRGCPDGLAHNPNYSNQVPSGWNRVGENVGCGTSVETIHKALMNSSGHRANILGDYREVGIGVRVDSRGSVWITQIFATYPSR